jgi:hypothetical protein
MFHFIPYPSTEHHEYADFKDNKLDLGETLAELGQPVPVSIPIHYNLLQKTKLRSGASKPRGRSSLAYHKTISSSECSESVRAEHWEDGSAGVVIFLGVSRSRAQLETELLLRELIQAEQGKSKENELDDDVLDFEEAVAELEKFVGMAALHTISFPAQGFCALTRSSLSRLCPAGGLTLQTMNP